MDYTPSLAGQTAFFSFFTLGRENFFPTQCKRKKAVCLRDYYTPDYGRSQQVVVDGIKSLACEVTSGVPQGSVLGPTLFLIYIVLNVKSEIQLFADDILMYKTIKNSNDHEILQEDLNTLTRWADTWLMEFNIPKCNVLQISTCVTKKILLTR